MIWNLAFGAVCAGVVGALIFDLWNWLAEKAVGIRAPHWGILGRWLLTPFNPAVSPVDGAAAETFTAAERLLGTIAHYATAIVFALGLMLAMGPVWMAEPSLLPALVAGVVTTLFAWFIIMPALGAGVAGARIPRPNRQRVATLVSHAVMGAGFYVGAAAAAATPLYGAFS